MLLSSVCNGCNYHEFPYRATPPIDNLRETEFNSIEDVNKIILKLIEETNEWNLKGKSFNVAMSVAKQLPFFCCPNKVLRADFQQAIERYVFCNETSTQAYSGAYGEQPYRWIQMYFTIKKAFAYKEQEQIKKNQINNGSSR